MLVVVVSVPGPSCHFGLKLSSQNLRSNVYKAQDKQILWLGRDLVHRGVLCSKFLPLGHRKEATERRPLNKGAAFHPSIQIHVYISA